MSGAARREELAEAIGSALNAHIQTTVKIENIASSGAISPQGSTRVRTDRGEFFFKWNFAGPPDMFMREAEGLRAMHAVGKVPVVLPVYACDCENGLSLFIAEFQDTYGARKGFDVLGRNLAEFHRAARGNRFGFDHDNYIGMTPQPNAWCDNWVEFFRERRLLFQLQLAEKNGYAGELRVLGNRLLDKLDDLIGRNLEPPTLLHGDLWSGNVLSPKGKPLCLIDPACYYGHREAELAMTRLFGGFPREFYDAYEETWPLAGGHERRLGVYTLYHLLNHLNLFGSGYLESVHNCMARILT